MQCYQRTKQHRQKLISLWSWTINEITRRRWLCWQLTLMHCSYAIARSGNDSLASFNFGAGFWLCPMKLMTKMCFLSSRAWGQLILLWCILEEQGNIWERNTILYLTKNLFTYVHNECLSSKINLCTSYWHNKNTYRWRLMKYKGNSVNKNIE